MGRRKIKNRFADVFVDIDRRKVHCLCAGEGEDVVFLHGWGASASAFLFVADVFADLYRVTLVDFAGFGDSDEAKTPLDVPRYAADVIAIFDALNISSATLVCHSFGGRVGMELAANFSDRVQKLVLVDSAGLKPRRGLKYHVRVGAHKLLKRLGFKGLKGSKDYRSLSPVMKETFKNTVNYDQFYLLCNISCPTAIFWGKRDRETPTYMARKLRRNIADSALFMLDGGHFCYAQDSAKFVAVLKAFLKG